ncbi:RHS repeat-associated core domain-containing protein [Corallococcus sp. BB11-1]|uniref:RHS repeat-associated core domain-containing protein n=1 Tax=Corallococcus sp. BB11-1 TaxID=2996783 RepID=UPI002270AF47|nr:RHS repeat-associated core domain-containing protein [Corallococcus sp. BB11-1]MCY1033719.1 RHS repeat-associated core domain-containing protein [Corallococcus sp. BB11-1]
MKKRWNRGAVRGLAVSGLLLVGLGVAWASGTLTTEELQQRVDQAPLSPAPPLGGPGSAGVSSSAPVPVGSLRPTYSETDYSLTSAIGDFAFTRTFSASTQANVLGIPGQRMLTPFGRVMNSNGTSTAYRWTHNLYSYVLIGTDWAKDPSGTYTEITPFCDVVAPSGTKMHFSPCDGDSLSVGAFATSSRDQNVKLRWDGDGFTLFSPEGRFRYTHKASVGGRSRPALPYRLWGFAYFLTEIEPTSYGNPVAQVGAAGRRLIASLQYHTEIPAGCSVPSTTYVKHSQMVQYASLSNGSRLAFTYASRPTQDTSLSSTHECVLDRVDLEEGTSGTGQGTRNVVTYDYGKYDENGQIVSTPAGMLSGARFYVGNAQNVPTGAEAPVPPQMTYSWVDNEALGTVRWKIFRDGVLVTNKTLHRANFYVLKDENDWTWQAVTASLYGTGFYCGPGVLTGTCAGQQWQNFSEPASAGDGYRQVSTMLTRSFVASESRSHGVETTGAVVKCGTEGVNNDGDCKGVGISLEAQQSRSWKSIELPVQSTLNVVPERFVAMAKTQRDSRNAYSVYTNKLAKRGDSDAEHVPWQDFNFFMPPGELKQADFGALDANGAGALLTKAYSYEYGRAGTSPAYEQLLKTESATSAVASRVGAGAQATWTYQYEPTTNRLMAKVRSGYTREFTTSFGALVPKHQAVFYRTHRSCAGETAAQADPQARVVEVEGPCWVTGPGATSCSGPSPVRHYFYGAANATNGQQQHLIRKRVYASFVSHGWSPRCQHNQFLDTTYDAYDEQGRLLKTTDPAGVQTVLSYSSGKLVRKTVKAGTLPDLITDYGYDNGTTHGDYVRHPDGRYEVHCYRTGTNGACVGGTLKDKLQWKATAASASGANYSERVNYFYRLGRLIKEETLAAGGIVRARRTYDADPLGRPTYQGIGEQWGEGASSNSTYSSTNLFDTEDNRIREGLPYLASLGRPAAFCGGFNTTTGALNSLPPECRSFEYDRLNRLVSMLEAAGPTGGIAASATHIAYDEAGNVKGIKQGCAPGTTMASCANQPAVEYLHDDFGNLLVVTAPWGVTLPSGPGVTWFAYDAVGNPIAKQTSEMGQSASWMAYQYDALGRILMADARRGDQTERFFRTWFEDPLPPLPNGCPAMYPGKPHYTVDSFGATWFEYDAFGRVTAKYRVRGAETEPPSRACNTSPYFSGKDSPNHFFSYDSVGRLVGEVYPYGRGIEYRYYPSFTGMSHRVSDIHVAHLYPDGTSSNDPLITSVEWEPYGGLKAYKVHSRGEAGVPPSAQVRYHQGGTNVGMVDCSSSSFTQAVDSAGVPFGRLSGMSVSRVTTGDVFKRAYRYKADQLEGEQTCILQTSSTDHPTMQEYRGPSGEPGYDARLQLGRVTNRHENGGWMVTDRTISYAYDVRGNRTSETQNGFTVQSEYANSFPRVDQLSKRNFSAPVCQPGQLGCLPYGITTKYWHDLAGRMTNADWYLSPTSTQSYYSLWLHAAPLSPLDLGAVYRQVGTNQEGGPGSNSEYLYDAGGRRRLKRTWDGREDEYFYSGTQLLVDVGYTAANPYTTDYVLDEYVWLDGRPVALVKSRFAHSSFLRVADNTQDCSRFGVESDVPCGTYFPVTDGLGKPVLLLDSRGRISGTGDYEPFGHVNRVAHFAASRDNFSYPIATLRAPSSPELVTQVRVRFEWVEAHGQARVYLTDAQRVKLPGAKLWDGVLYGGAMGRPVTPGWVTTPSDGTFYVRMGADTIGQTHTEAHLSSFEYRRYEPNAKPVWLPLRLPGQYFDPETDLFENWNRYYDAALGRYLAPEPLYSDAGWMLSRVGSMPNPSVYAYASNNPVSLVDPDGRCALADPAGVCEALNPVNWAVSAAAVIALVDIAYNAVTGKHVGSVSTGEVKSDPESVPGTEEAAAAAATADEAGSAAGAAAPVIPDEYWAGQQALVQITPGSARAIDDLKPSSRAKGEEYVRTSHYDAYGRLVGQDHPTAHGESGVHPNPHHHVRDPKTNSRSGPKPGLFRP